jgi:hypothetical protein
MFNGYETEELVEAHIQALLREVEDCERAGRGDRAEMARAELKKFGYKAQTPEKRAEKRPRAQKAETRG